MQGEKYLKLLSAQYPDAARTALEIIKLSSVLNLPKSTEHFVSDIHGEAASFLHVLKSGSGSIRKKIDDEFSEELTESEKRELATLIYYPAEKLEIEENERENFGDWCRTALLRLIRVTRRVASKYSREKLKQVLSSEFAYIIDELLTEKAELPDKEAYYNGIIQAILGTGRAKAVIAAFCQLSQRLAVERLHVIGDIYDRGAGAVTVMDALENRRSVDIQWGNHDISWMGAASGSEICIANVVRISARYGNLSTLEDGYGINLIPLERFASEIYGGDDCARFYPEAGEDEKERALTAKIHKAIAVIQLKLEGQLALRRPEFGMRERIFLDKIDREKGTVRVGEKTYPLADAYFPTVDPARPYELTAGEARVCARLKEAFRGSEKLRRHVEFLFSCGSMYRICNGNLLYHGCIPLEKDGSFKSAEIAGKSYAGKALYDVLEKWIRKGRYSASAKERAYGRDVMWFVWSNEKSPLYGKDKMATFERYFIADAECYTEEKNAYYRLWDDEATVKRIFAEFGIDMERGHIINGHVPVKVKKGESPVHCGGRLIIIDGGFSRTYQGVTGIAGYTLVSDSRMVKLIAHEPFVSTEEAVRSEREMHSTAEIVSRSPRRLRTEDTDAGKELRERIADLTTLLEAYRNGSLKEQNW